MKQILLIASLVAASTGAAADTPKTHKTNEAVTAFARLKSLVGEWESNDKTRMTYELVGNGTALLEREATAKGRPSRCAAGAQEHAEPDGVGRGRQGPLQEDHILEGWAG
jgi:hypothetical protein